MKVKIKSIRAREILDSRGNPTIEAEIIADCGFFQASVPSGVSRGKYEAIELRDGGKRYCGKGVLKAIKNINEILGPKLKGENVLYQKDIDETMIKLDGTKQKSKIGGNAITAVSMAVCRAGAAAKKIPLYQYIAQLAFNKKGAFQLPRPCFNIINGGSHAGNDLDIQEFMVSSKIKSFSESLRIAAEIYYELKSVIRQKYGDLAANIGDEGGFAPPVCFAEQALELISKAAKNLSYKNKIEFFLDCAASGFFRGISGTGKKKEGQYKLKAGLFTGEGLLKYYLNLVKKYPIVGLEDPFAEDDWEKFSDITKKIGNKIKIIGDDLLVTNPQRIRMAGQKNACNGLLLKINQIGTVSEALEAAKIAQNFGWDVMVSHRSGETCDDFIADLAVGIGAKFIKAGAPARGERTAKYNRLLKIEEEVYRKT